MATKKTTGKTSAAKRARTKIKKLSRTRPPRKEHNADILDAMKVERAAKRHAAALKKKGLKDAELAQLTAQIKKAKALEKAVGRVSLDDARTAAKDLTGEFRRAAKLAASGLTGRDATTLKALRADVAFPPNDPLLDAYLTDIGGVMKPYAAKLAERDFPAAKQAALARAAEAFHAALEARPEENAQRHEKSQEREQAFQELRTMTSYVRDVGRDALIDRAARAEFDRERPAKKKAKPATDTPPAG